MTTHEILVGARNRIAIGGWCRDYGEEQGPYCIVAAVHRSCAEDVDDRPVFQLIAAEIGIDEGPGLCADIGDWNDREESSESEVLDLLDGLIATTAPEPDTSFLTDPILEEARAR